MAKPARVLVVDDSALMRQLLTRILNASPELEVVGTAGDPYAAREKIIQLQPDVLTLDIEMPRMDGITFLEKLMRAHPMPVVMISSLTEKSAEVTLRALSLGAVDFVSKPKLDVLQGTVEQSDEILSKVVAAAGIKVRERRATGARPEPLPTSGCRIAATHKVVAVGASTGGTEALKDLLSPLPADFPGIVIVQHMPEAFTRQFAARLDNLCRIRVKEARDGDRILPGHALLAPGGHHMALVRRGMEYPSVDVLFSSCARQLGANALGVLLTGMGADGARGLLELRETGAVTFAEDESTCVVFGMPQAAIRMGAVDQALPLHKIPAALLQRLRQAEGISA
jgi:two-component system chemotaxis response regulator CheB